MDEVLAWRELAARFRELAEADQYRLYASWSSTALNAHWFIAGSAQSISESFKWLAERAAVLLGQQPGEATLFFWLDLLKEGSPRYRGGGTSESYDVEGRCTEKADTGMVTGVCLASAEYCYKLETAAIAKQEPAVARLELISANMKDRARAKALEEYLIEKEKDSLRLKDSQADVGNIADEPLRELPGSPHLREKQVGPKSLRKAYLDSFAEKIKILDICWASGQHYSEWKRWLRGAIKNGSTADLAFRAVLLSGKKPSEYRKQPRPSKWK